MSLKTDIDQLVADAAIMHNIVQGPAALVNTAGGPVKSLALAVGDLETEAIASAAAALASQNSATASAEAASSSASSAASSAATATTKADITTADVVLTHADVVLTNADVALTHADVVLTHADVVTTNADAAAAAAQAETSTTQAGIATTKAGIATTKASEASTSATSASNSATTATTQAGTATTKAVEASASAQSANGAAGASKWVSGTTYAEGDCRWSPINYLSYRRKVAGAGTTDPANDTTNWARVAIDAVSIASNNIGIAGQAGFGQGICPAVPAGYTPLSGCTDPLSANYGRYQYSDSSVMAWVPAFFMRIGDSRNSTYTTYGVNSISIKAISTFPDDATANAEGYYRHRAFINAGANQLGFFRDCYDNSNNAGTASSIANAMPLVSGPAAGQVGFSALTGAPTNAYHGAIPSAKTRGAKFFPESAFIADALCRISEAHAQHADSSTYCAWYDGTGVKNYPKGCDNNALKSESDLTVSFTTAGASSYPNFALAGSGVPFAKTTHNGQACGISDVAGNIYKINPGMTCTTTTKVITGATQANPVALTVVAHGYTTGQAKMLTGVVGMTQLNGKFFLVTVVDADHVTLDGVDGTAFGAYTSGGTVTTGIFYTLKPSVDIAALTSGITLSTDHWGATGIAANFDAVTPNFATTYPNNGYAQRYGNGANAVFDMSTSNGRALAMLGMPAAGGMSVSGSNAMGLDYFYQNMVDQLCVISRGYWDSGSGAGSRFRNFGGPRSDANYSVGFACASYL